MALSPGEVAGLHIHDAAVWQQHVHHIHSLRSDGRAVSDVNRD
jgi:hypothetical protein